MDASVGGSAAPAALLDGVLDRPAVVVGGLPPTARDLDLLVVAQQRSVVAAALTAAGYTEDDGSWRRAGTADAADVLVPGEHGIPVDHADWIFAGARPLEGYARLRRPSPAAELLLLAGRYGSQRGFARPGHPPRVLDALADDADALREARSRAGAWHVERALPLLVAHACEGRPPGLVARHRLVREQQRREQLDESLPRLRAAVRAALRR